MEVDGEFPDLSKKHAFERYLDLPKRIPSARFELAMNIKPDDPEQQRLIRRGWRVADPHVVARTPSAYRRYIASATAEFTAIKGVDVSWRTGWVSDRAAAFLARGRPVMTEDTGAAKVSAGGRAVFFLCVMKWKRKRVSTTCWRTGRAYQKKRAHVRAKCSKRRKICEKSSDL